MDGNMNLNNQDFNNQNLNNTTVEVKKKSKGGLIIFIVLLLIIGGVAGWYFVKHREGDKQDNKNEVKEEMNKKEDLPEEKKETESKNKDNDSVYKELSDKVDLLAHMNYPGLGVFFAKDRKLVDFSEIDLVSVVLYGVKKQDLEEEIYYDYEQHKKVDELTENAWDEIDSYVLSKDLSDLHKELFGKDFPHKDKIQYCPVMIFDKEINGYYLAYPCGGTGYDEELHYVYDYELDGNKAYAYVAFGVIPECDGCLESEFYDDAGEPIDEPDFDLYTDFERKNKYSGKVTTGFEINESNYKDFSKYKVTFEKGDSSYRFVSIERLK